MQVWRVDVGMSSGVLDAPVGFLEIRPAASGQEDVTCRIITVRRGPWAGQPPRRAHGLAVG
jgi:hypothetical protein